MNLLTTVVSWPINAENQTTQAEHPSGLSQETREQIAKVIQGLPNRELAEALAYHYSAEGNVPHLPQGLNALEFICSAARKSTAPAEGVHGAFETLGVAVREWVQSVVESCDDPLGALAVVDEWEQFIGRASDDVRRIAARRFVEREPRFRDAVMIDAFGRLFGQEVEELGACGQALVVLSTRARDKARAKALIVFDDADRSLPSVTPTTMTDAKKRKPLGVQDVAAGRVLRVVAGYEESDSKVGWLLPCSMRIHRLADAQLAHGQIQRKLE